MASISLFTLPVPVYQQPTITRSPQQRSLKRKRGGKTEGQRNAANDNRATQSDTQEATEQDDHRSTFSEYSAVLTPDERHQYRIAGQPFDQLPPHQPFPHTPPSLGLLTRTGAHVQERLADLDPPIYPSKSDARSITLHQQHLAVITVILHRCLMEKDFVRAGRALSLILRDGIGGRSIDVRSEGMWGIGAEILLRQGAQSKHNIRVQPPSSSLPDRATAGREQPLPSLFTRKGFEDAKTYYERLIIQYPFHKPVPAAVSALHFYPAMFGLWVYVAHEESKVYLAQTNQPGAWDSCNEPLLALMAEKSRIVGAKQGELEQGREIAKRMDSCMENLPFADDPDLMSIRGMVGLWIADLCDTLIEQPGSDEEDMNYERSLLVEVAGGSTRVSLDDTDESMPTSALHSEAAQSKATANKWFEKLSRKSRKP